MKKQVSHIKRKLRKSEINVDTINSPLPNLGIKSNFLDHFLVTILRF